MGEVSKSGSGKQLTHKLKIRNLSVANWPLAVIG